MITVHELVSDIRLEPEDFERLMRRLLDEGKEPASYQARQRFWDAAKGSHVDGNNELGLPLGGRNGVGDVFFPNDEDVLFFLARGPQLRGDQTQIVYYAEEEGEVSVSVGLFTLNPDGATNRLEEFAATLEEAIRKSVDGRKTRHMSFAWRKPHETNPLIQRLREGDGDDADGIHFVQATLTDDAVRGSEALVEPDARDVLIQVSQARIAQESDLSKGRPPAKRKQVEAALKSLDAAGLVEVNQLIHCPKANDPLMQLSDISEVEAVKNILHPACGRTYGDHDVVPAYALSPLGEELIRGSHWMTVWVTKRLVDLGVPLEEIVWTLASGPEEIDIALSFLGELWIFELKDREFGVGDALPFNYRHRVRYKAEQAAVITTEKVSRDAKQVLDEMVEEAKQASRGTFFTFSDEPDSAPPILIEGLDNAEGGLRSCLDQAAAKAADRRLKKLESATGFPVAGAVRARLNHPIPTA